MSELTTPATRGTNATRRSRTAHETLRLRNFKSNLREPLVSFVARRFFFLLPHLLTLLLSSLLLPASVSAQVRVVHVYVALADNRHQGIVPVPAKLGNGEDPARNLYWGAAYGLKTFFSSS